MVRDYGPRTGGLFPVGQDVSMSARMGEANVKIT